jgi:hypothetical protein
MRIRRSNHSLGIHPPVLAVATQKPLFSHDVPLTAAVITVFLLGGIKVVVDTVVTRLIVVHIHPSTSLTVLALFLLGSGGHLYRGSEIGENG